MRHADYTFLGTTQSLCPDCLTQTPLQSLVPTKIIARNKRVYFRKRCPKHGTREDFICSDVAQYDQMAFSLPAKVPQQMGVEPKLGCPFDCGLCTEHEQHTCIGLVEITDACNLTCPMCYAGSAPGLKHRAFDDCRRAIDRLVEVEGRPEVLQLSGGEPTVHPEFEQIFRYAISRPIDYVMVNTNGLRLAKDPALVELLASERQRTEVYLQFDGFDERTSLLLRGESVVAAKLAAIEALGRAKVHVTLVVTLQAGVNEHEIGRIAKFAAERPWITSVSYQPATYSGRHVFPSELEQRITFPDVVRALEEQSEGMFRSSDFMPLPCAHPNCHQIAYAYRSGGTVLPLDRFIDTRANMDLLANGISFTRPAARALLTQYLARQSCCGGSCGPTDAPDKRANNDRRAPAPLQLLGNATNGLSLQADGNSSLAEEFFAGALAENLGAQNVFRITITNFLDAYNFDVRRVMKCCVHHVLPSGHVVPFCAYNVLYRNGLIRLPDLISLSHEAAK